MRQLSCFRIFEYKDPSGLQIVVILGSVNWELQDYKDYYEFCKCCLRIHTVLTTGTTTGDKGGNQVLAETARLDGKLREFENVELLSVYYVSYNEAGRGGVKYTLSPAGTCNSLSFIVTFEVRIW